MSPVLRPSETIVCSVVLAPFLGISYLWYLFTSLPIVDLGYENYQASSFNQQAGYYAFSDIRYAAPPLGDLRFRPPVSPAANRAFLQQEDRPSRICPQGRVRWEYDTGHDFLQSNINGTTMRTYNAPPSFFDTPSNSLETEDCLFLDIFVPQSVFESRQQIAQTEKPGAPVVVWIHGGEGISGSKTLPAQPFEILKHGLLPRSFRPDATVLVSVNYRLGAFGAFGDFGRPSDDPSLERDGNVSASSIGMQDQRMAIRWVREKIKLFGGDAGRVTIIRGGADGSTVGVHGLYHTAAAAADERVLRQHAVLPDGLTIKSFLRLANVSSLAEARGLPSEKLIAANKALMDMLV